jgi:hypothetical protein
LSDLLSQTNDFVKGATATVVSVTHIKEGVEHVVDLVPIVFGRFEVKSLAILPN